MFGVHRLRERSQNIGSPSSNFPDDARCNLNTFEILDRFQVLQTQSMNCWIKAAIGTAIHIPQLEDVSSYCCANGDETSTVKGKVGNYADEICCPFCGAVAFDSNGPKDQPSCDHIEFVYFGNFFKNGG